MKAAIQKQKTIVYTKSLTLPATDLISILEGAGLQLSAELRSALTVFESECLRSYVDQTTYESLLADFKEILEERF